ncbi:unnamed protein product [Effrenium voratum]|nr:unnamed protein product [Effrenium voratum]
MRELARQRLPCSTAPSDGGKAAKQLRNQKLKLLNPMRLERRALEEAGMVQGAVFFGILRMRQFCFCANWPRLYPLGKELSVDKGSVFKVVPVQVLPVVLKRQVEAILALCDREPKVTDFVQSLMFPNAAWEEPPALEVDSKDFERFNEQQRRAVAASSASLTLVQGPPGTGKSDVAAAIVERWLQEDSTKSILVATGTHAGKETC